MNRLTASLELAWDAFCDQAAELAAATHETSRQVSPWLRRRLLFVKVWLGGSLKLPDAYIRPDILAICLAWLDEYRRLPAGQDKVPFAGLLRATHRAACQIAKDFLPRGSAVALFRYPCLLLLAIGTLFVAFSFWLAPTFENMFNEFGLKLPFITEFVLSASAILRDGWWIALVVVSLGFWLMIESIGLYRSVGAARNRWTRWPWRPAGKRQAVAKCADHLASLTASGLEISAATSILLPNKRVGDAINTISQDRLLAGAIATKDSRAQEALLHARANYCREFGDASLEWLFRLLGNMLLGLIFLLILFLVFSLLSPLVALISGLTGTPF